MQRLYCATINPDTEITITAGATYTIFTAIAAFVSSGDEVILIEPLRFLPALHRGQRRVPVSYKLSAPGLPRRLGSTLADW